MNNYADELRNYEEEAESRYNDYDEDGYEEEYDPAGNEDGYEEDSFDDDRYDEFDEIEYVTHDYDAYYTAPRRNIGRIDPNDRTLTISIVNTSGAEAEVIVFGANENAAQPAGLTVTVGESSHNEVKEESKANPFSIRGMKMSVSDPLQFDNVLRIVRRTSTGANFQRVYQPRNATSPQNFSQQLIDDGNFEMDVTGQDSLRFLVRAGATVGFTFTISTRANMGNLLRGNNVAEVSNAPRTTGLPQLDLMRSQAANNAPEGQPQIKKIKRVRNRAKAANVAKSVLMPHTNIKKLFRRRKKKR